jgi:hypothetical protein
MNIRTVCDFRSQAEVNRAPDRLPAKTSVDYVHLPVTRENFEPASAFERMKRGELICIAKRFDFLVHSPSSR